MVLLLTLVYFGQNVMSYGLAIFMPAIIKTQSGVSSQVASFLAMIPYVVAFVGMLVNGWHSDRTGERIWHVSLSLFAAGCGLFAAAALDSVPLAAIAVLMFWVGTFMYAHLPAFWPIPTMFLGAVVAASAIGFINMIGNLGGFFGPYWVGNSVDVTSSGKLTPDENSELRALLGQIRVGRALDEAQRGKLTQFLAKGASFAGALRRLAPWPILSAVIIVVVGVLRKRQAGQIAV
jgi:MFS family permease